MKIYENKIFQHSNINEINVNSLQYDSNIYVEPDGSTWVHLIHHNSPADGLFTKNQTDSYWFAGVYENANRWYDAERLFSQVSSWEFMLKQATTAGATESKYRWIQTKNPLNAVWDDVKPASVTRITTPGYTNGSNGGLWKMNSSARLCIANSNSGNWFGALGSWTAYSGGTPGYPNTAVTTGYMDLYMRVSESNINNSSNRFSISPTGLIANQIYEY